jgi:hypothetical protein
MMDVKVKFHISCYGFYNMDINITCSTGQWQVSKGIQTWKVLDVSNVEFFNAVEYHVKESLHYWEIY